MFLRQAWGGLDLLTEARLDEQFPVLRQNLSALYAGYYVAELLADGTQDYDPHPVLFDAALGALRELGKGSESPAVVSAFELVWLRELGYSPRLDACATCGSEVQPEGNLRAVFSPSAGGAVPRAAGRGRPTLADGAALAALRDLTAAAEVTTRCRWSCRPRSARSCGRCWARR